MCVCALYVQSYISLAPLEVGCRDVRVSVSVCGRTPPTLAGSRQSESTMNLGTPPWLGSERSPVGGGGGGGVGGCRE